MTTLQCLLGLLDRRVPAERRAWLDSARAEIGRGIEDERFCVLFSLASRFAPRAPLAPDAAERARAAQALAGWNPERWSILDAFRAVLVLSRSDLSTPSAARAIEELFRYADMGELCAAYKLLALVPQAERFVWRAGEGARSSMKAVYESACCDTPFPARYFDDIAWRQALIKALFVEAPLWRVWNVDARLDEELARMALDLADERRSAGRPVNPETWMCLGTHGGARAQSSIERELVHGPARGRAGAALALARAGRRDKLLSASAVESDPFVKQVMGSALDGAHDSVAFHALDQSTSGVC
ncbi:MAG: EboA domain-containing protein [Planctomycetes bacterium]|nr:EboA domain-containing protein [Planctomycetota bacterium]